VPRPDQRAPAALVAAVIWLLGVAGLAQMSARLGLRPPESQLAHRPRSTQAFVTLRFLKDSLAGGNNCPPSSTEPSLLP